MRLLLDTHIALWAIVDDARLPQPAANLIVDPRYLIVVSAASVWEIAIKHGLARGRANDMPVSASDALGYFRAAGYELLGDGVADAARATCDDREAAFEGKLVHRREAWGRWDKEARLRPVLTRYLQPAIIL